MVSKNISEDASRSEETSAETTAALAGLGPMSGRDLIDKQIVSSGVINVENARLFVDEAVINRIKGMESQAKSGEMGSGPIVGSPAISTAKATEGPVAKQTVANVDTTIPTQSAPKTTLAMLSQDAKVADPAKTLASQSFESQGTSAGRSVV